MSPDPSPAVSFNVLGSCVSRDILSSPKGPKYEVRGYVKCVNLLLIGQRRPESVGELGDGDIERLSDPRLRHGFYARTAKLLFNLSCAIASRAHDGGRGSPQILGTDVVSPLRPFAKKFRVFKGVHCAVAPFSDHFVTRSVIARFTLQSGTCSEVV